MKTKLVILLILFIGICIAVFVNGCKEVEAQSVSVNLLWTAPFDDFNDINSGPVTKYELRYSVDSVSLVNNFSTVSGGFLTIVPKTPGETETHTLAGLTANTTYYVGVKSYDEKNNVSPISNVLKITTPDTTPPSAITDLRKSL